MIDDAGDLPLFHGPHLPRFRFERALERLDLRAAAADAPEMWRTTVEQLAAVVEDAKGVARADPERIAAGRRDGWPAGLERAWQRLLGRCLDGHGVPGTYNGELAAAFLLRGGERERAHASVRRHLERHPRDVRAWELLAHFEPVRAAARCGFHGGRLLEEAAGDLIDLVREDELEPVEPWLLGYAWLARRIDLAEIHEALKVEDMTRKPPLPVPNDPHAFAWYLAAAGGRRYGDAVDVVEARRRLQRISPAAFRRYLRRV